MPTVTAQPGDCILSIAVAHGLFHDSVWSHADNSALRELRKDPNVLLPGDEVFVPDLVEKDESCPTEARHRFRRKGVPAKLRLRLLIDNQPQANASYTFIVDGLSRTGSTNGDGKLEETVPVGAQQGELRVTKDGHERRYYLALGSLNPHADDSGVSQRLRQLGYNVGDADGDAPAPGLEAAIRGFQHKQGLTVNGTIDDALRNKLKEVYGQ